MKKVLVVASALISGAIGFLVYSFNKNLDYHVVNHRLKVLPPGSKPIKILHLSDIHMSERQNRKRKFIKRLYAEAPDLIINTGDNISSNFAIADLENSLNELLDIPGVFVFGSNDYFAPRPVKPLRYLIKKPFTVSRRTIKRLDTLRLEKILKSKGWILINNRRDTLEVNGTKISFVGVNDPHIGADEFPYLEHNAIPEDSVLKIGVTHAPYIMTIQQMLDDDCDFIFAGHTHGGQVRLPKLGALITNSDLPRKYAKGLFDLSEVHSPAISSVKPVYLQVSGGIGSPPSFPLRPFNAPEAVMITLLPKGA
ncbi:MAG: metallophosphoesterase family protein [Bifidobacteriaceae bacterium]|jgi:predicted MPP superfamily phosphohydrolase|nr:metallophosphoesterase family protein [Bifidobacteriaceae bacterium]